MKVKLWNVVLFADEFDSLINWYIKIFNFDVLTKESIGHNYVELGFKNEIILGFTTSKEINHISSKPKNNSCILQLEITEMKALFEKVLQEKGNILFGPELDKKNNMLFGAFNDIEGNQIWVFENL